MATTPRARSLIIFQERNVESVGTQSLRVVHQTVHAQGFDEKV